MFTPFETEPPFSIYFHLEPQSYLTRKLPVLHCTDFHFCEHLPGIQHTPYWHLSPGCADSLALICHFQKHLFSHIFQPGGFVGQRVKAGYLWVEADNGHFITQTSFVLKLRFSRIRQVTPRHDFDSANWNRLQHYFIAHRWLCKKLMPYDFLTDVVS